MPLSPNTRKTLLIASAITLVIILIREFAAKSDSVMVLIGMPFPALISDGSLARNLDSPDRRLLVDSLGMLGGRNDPVGTAKAKELLTSDDAWIHGAMYLGHFKDPTAIPYLIKALRVHEAAPHYPGVTGELKDLTGQNISQDYQKWHDWWMQTHPDSTFDFNSHTD
jgi:hypothetical protein